MGRGFARIGWAIVALGFRQMARVIGALRFPGRFWEHQLLIVVWLLSRAQAANRRARG